MSEITIRIAGEAGQGIETIGLALSRLFKDAGFHIFAVRDYMSRIRGGNNFLQLRVSGSPLYCPRERCDIAFVLDRGSIALHRPDLSNEGVLVLDRKKFGETADDPAFFDVPFYDIARRSVGADIYINTVALAVIAALIKVSFPMLEKVIAQTFKRKGEGIIKKNLEAARAGYDFTVAGKRGIASFDFSAAGAPSGESRLMMNGHDALALGAIRAGCKFYSGYPMTPSTGILYMMAHYSKKYNIIVEQAEDEIGAVNMVIGASFAGCRSMTATSGGGFALMTEGLSLAAMTETPLVIVVGQRPGPATGFPTRTEQGELDFLMSAGHGEFARVIYTPGTVQQGYAAVIKAFNTAEQYQIPVIIATDQFFADSYLDVERFHQDAPAVKRYSIASDDAAAVQGYKRYALTPSGISPLAVPGRISGVVYADSDEHNEQGHITEDAQMRKKMVEKRFAKKMRALLKEVEQPQAYAVKDADIVLVGFGSTYGVMKEVCESFEHKRIGFIHMSQVWPFPSEAMLNLLQGVSRAYTIENNCQGQLARLIRRETGVQVSGSLLKYDGRPFTLDEVTRRLRQFFPVTQVPEGEEKDPQRHKEQL